MEKDSEYQGCSQGLFQHDKRNVARKQVSAKSVCCRRRSQKNPHENYQIMLEKDIAKLQKQLKQEMDTHRTLERALTRTLGTLPRFSPGLATEVQKLVAEVAVLEEEVVHLEESKTMLHQGLLHNEGAMCNSHAGQVQIRSVRSQICPTVAKGRPSNPAFRSSYATERRSSVIAKLLPCTIESGSSKPVCFDGSPANGEPTQKLSRSFSFRRESSPRTFMHMDPVMLRHD